MSRSEDLQYLHTPNIRLNCFAGKRTGQLKYRSGYFKAI